MKIKQLVIITMLLTLFGLSFTKRSGAEEAVSAKSYSGDFWSRSTFTGDWGGTRNDWAKKGVTFDMSLTQTGMSVISGGKNQGWEYSGRGDLTLNIDTQKLGLWPGGSITVEVEGNYNQSINLDSGTMSPVNTNQIFPTTGSDQLNIPNVTIMHFFLQHYIGVFAGKLATITSHSGDMNEFAHGKGDTQFLNMAFNFNPTVSLTVPYSTLAAGVIILPTKNPAEAIINIMAYDGNGEAESSGFDTVFKGNTNYAIEGRMRTDFFGLTGHQLVGVTYSTRDFASLDQSMHLIIENGAIKQKDSSWSFHYNFDQYLYEPKKGQGIGIFGRFGASDGNPNPVHYFYSLGIGGKGVLGRPLDQFGIGFYYMDISNPKFTAPVETREFLRDEYGIEAYYSLAITPWMKLTPDIQLVRGAQKEKLVSTSPLVKEGIDTATVVGLRLQVIF
jgi:porin